ncbi:HAD-IA family hydrolase [candidate division WWE3 bacterium]|uniref:HAD-IA family hydrolase n=1 Tax=candidate division WWE3 bacterium TaxID=2053526 RepID=A0A955RQL6_UNCKA|nr:HAD-IA family hydrolase [candidate division WWE3 bacterium]
MKTILVDAINTFVIKESGIFEEMFSLLEQYPNKKIILTGANQEQMIQFGLDRMPYDVFTLNHNPEKTDPAYYRTMLQKYGLAPQNVVYFEHDADAVRSATSVGITTFHYDKDKKDLSAVKAFLDTNLQE